MINRFSATKTLKNKYKSCRPFKVTKRLRRKFVNALKKNQNLSAPRIIQELSNMNAVELFPKRIAFS